MTHPLQHMNAYAGTNSYQHVWSRKVWKWCSRLVPTVSIFYSRVFNKNFFKVLFPFDPHLCVVWIAIVLIGVDGIEIYIKVFDWLNLVSLVVSIVYPTTWYHQRITIPSCCVSGSSLLPFVSRSCQALPHLLDHCAMGPLRLQATRAWWKHGGFIGYNWVLYVDVSGPQNVVQCRVWIINME